MTPQSADEVDNGILDDDEQVRDRAKWYGLEPLPEEKYPRVVKKRVPEQGYYIALGLVMLVWMITPLSW